MPGWVWFFVVVVAVPAIGMTISDMFKRYVKFHEKKLELMSREAAEKAARYAAHTERLEQRVQVLERIATDKGVDLAHEIERLRDQRAPLN